MEASGICAVDDVVDARIRNVARRTVGAMRVKATHDRRDARGCVIEV